MGLARRDGGQRWPCCHHHHLPPVTRSHMLAQSPSGGGRRSVQVQAGPGCGSLLPSAGALVPKAQTHTSHGAPEVTRACTCSRPSQASPQDEFWGCTPPTPPTSECPNIRCFHCPQSPVLPKDQSHTWSRGEKDPSVTRGWRWGRGRQGSADWGGGWIVGRLNRHKSSRMGIATSKNALCTYKHTHTHLCAQALK